MKTCVQYFLFDLLLSSRNSENIYNGRTGIWPLLIRIWKKEIENRPIYSISLICVLFSSYIFRTSQISDTHKEKCMNSTKSTNKCLSNKRPFLIMLHRPRMTFNIFWSFSFPFINCEISNIFTVPTYVYHYQCRSE